MNWIITDNWGNTSEVRVVISSDADNLEAAIRSAEKEGWESATVEAEYGNRVVTGSWATLAHRVHFQAVQPTGTKPCIYWAPAWGSRAVCPEANLAYKNKTKECLYK